MPSWTWAAASRRGTSHIKTETPCQDAMRCFLVGNGEAAPFVALLCDGAGSASKGGQGAALIVRILSRLVREHYDAQVELPTDADVTAWIETARQKLFTLAATRTIDAREFACTLVFVVSDGSETLVAHVGDGAVVVRESASEQWKAISWPAQGEYASTTFFVTEKPEPRISITRHAANVDGLAAFTDGIERLALDFANNVAHPPFFTGIFAPVISSAASGRDDQLSSLLSIFLDSDAVNSRTDDDKTVLIAARK